MKMPTSSPTGASCWLARSTTSPRSSTWTAPPSSAPRAASSSFSPSRLLEVDALLVVLDGVERGVARRRRQRRPSAGVVGPADVGQLVDRRRALRRSPSAPAPQRCRPSGVVKTIGALARRRRTGTSPRAGPAPSGTRRPGSRSRTGRAGERADHAADDDDRHDEAERGRGPSGRRGSGRWRREAADMSGERYHSGCKFATKKVCIDAALWYRAEGWNGSEVRRSGGVARAQEAAHARRRSRRVALELFAEHGLPRRRPSADRRPRRRRSAHGLRVLPGQGGARLPPTTSACSTSSSGGCRTAARARRPPTPCARGSRRSLRRPHGARQDALPAPEVVESDHALRTYERGPHRAGRAAIAGAAAVDLGLPADDLLPRMVGAATIAALDALGRAGDEVIPQAEFRERGLALVDQAMTFVGAGIRGLQDAA